MYLGWDLWPHGQRQVVVDAESLPVGQYIGRKHPIGRRRYIAGAAGAFEISTVYHSPGTRPLLRNHSVKLRSLRRIFVEFLNT